MRLASPQARQRLAAADHGVLCTVHHERGADAVPVVFAVIGDHLAVPIDRVKPKSTVRLQRERNLATDPRATLLVEQWDAEDWSRLWWVRAELLWAPEVPETLRDSLTEGLATKYPQYADRPFTGVLVLEIVAVTGWAATAPRPTS